MEAETIDHLNARNSEAWMQPMQTAKPHCMPLNPTHPFLPCICKREEGATVKLQWEAKGTADKDGYFFIQAPPKVTSYAFHMFMLSSPLPTCNNATDLHNGLTGAALRFRKIMLAGAKNMSLYTVGSFAFAPNTAHPWSPLTVGN